MSVEQIIPTADDFLSPHRKSAVKAVSVIGPTPAPATYATAAGEA